MAHRKALLACLAEQAAAQPALELYAIVDAGQDSRIAASIARLEVAGRANLFEGLPEESLPALTPWLLQLDGREPGTAAAQACLQQLCELAQTWPCVSWLLSPQALADLATHLRQWLNGIVLDSDGSALGAVLLRYYDARTLPGFFAMLSPGQYAKFMHPITACGLWTRFNTWQQWLAVAPPQVFPSPRQAYTLEQQAAYARMTCTDRLHAMLEAHYGAQGSASERGASLAGHYFKLPQDERHRCLDGLLSRARSKGLAEDDDLFLFASLAFDLHPAFDAQPEFAAAIARAATSACSLAEALAHPLT